MANGENVVVPAGMKEVKFVGKAKSAFGKKITGPAVKYAGSFLAYTSYDALKAANDLLSNEGMVKAVNNKRKAAAKASAQTAALEAAGYEKPTLKDPQERMKMIIRAITADDSTSREDAIEQAEKIVGVKFEGSSDEDDE